MFYTNLFVDKNLADVLRHKDISRLKVDPVFLVAREQAFGTNDELTLRVEGQVRVIHEVDIVELKKPFDVGFFERPSEKIGNPTIKKDAMIFCRAIF